jgi:tetratricopeptide (TPR) repeat protein
MALAGVNHWHDFDHARAEEQFRIAMRDSPEHAGVRNWHADFLMEMLRFDEAFEANREAGVRAPDWLEVDTVRGNIFLYMGRPSEAVPYYLKALQLEPNHGLTRFFLGQAYLALDRQGDAVAELRRAGQAMGDPPFARAGLANALAQAGRRADAEEMLAEFERLRAGGYYPAFALAMVHVGLGNHAEALDWLDRAFDERLMGYYLPSVGQLWDPLRTDPRFQDLLRRLGLPHAPA